MPNAITNHSGLKDLLKVCLLSDVVPFIVGSAGIGKSAIVKQLAEENNLDLIDLRLTQLQP